MCTIQIPMIWEDVRKGLIESIKKLSPEDLLFVPFPGSWNVGQILLHIAEAEEGWFQYVILRQYTKWPDQFCMDDYPTTAAMINVLSDVHQKTLAYLETNSELDFKTTFETPWGRRLSLNWIIWHVIEHEIHHRGEISLILGMLGKEGLDV